MQPNVANLRYFKQFIGNRKSEFVAKFFRLKFGIFICNMTVNYQILSFLHWSWAMHFRINWGLVKVRYISWFKFYLSLTDSFKWELIVDFWQTANSQSTKTKFNFNPSQTISKKHKRNWVFATTSNFLISLSLQLGSVNLRIFNPTKFIVWQILLNHGLQR